MCSQGESWLYKWYREWYNSNSDVQQLPDSKPHFMKKVVQHMYYLPDFGISIQLAVAHCCVFFSAWLAALAFFFLFFLLHPETVWGVPPALLMHLCSYLALNCIGPLSFWYYIRWYSLRSVVACCVIRVFKLAWVLSGIRIAVEDPQVERPICCFD